MSEVVHASQGYVEKTARTIAAEEVAKIVAGADTNYDTLKEIADYIKGDAAGAAELKNKVSALGTDKADKTALEAEERRAKDAESALDERVQVLETSGGGGGSGGGSSVEVVPPSVEGAGKAADAAAVYDALNGKQDKLTYEQLAACESGITKLSYLLLRKDVDENSAAIDKKQDTLTEEQLAAVNSGITSDAYATLLRNVSTNASAIETLSNTVGLVSATLEDALGEEVGE